MEAQPHTTQKVPAKRRGINPQPLNVAQLDNAFLTLKTASAVSGLSEATLYRKAAAGELALIKIGLRCTRISAAELRRFMAAQG